MILVGFDLSEENDKIEFLFECIFNVCLIFSGKFAITEEFPVEQLYSIYEQKHALDDFAFAIEFKVSFSRSRESCSP